MEQLLNKRIGSRKVISIDPPKHILVKCDCGNIKRIQSYYFTRSKSQICGECEFFKFKTSGQRKFNSLTIIDDFEILTKFGQNVKVKCDCGFIVNAILRQVYYGRKKNCGHCSFNKFKQTSPTIFNDLKLLTPLNDISHWMQLVDVECACGNKSSVIYRNLAIGNTKSCGQCKLVKFKISGQKVFGNLTITTPIGSIRSLSQEVSCDCRCGNQSSHKLFNIITGHTQGCGQCYVRIRSIYDKNIKDFRVTYPIAPGVIFGCIKYSNIINNSNTVLIAKCPICDNDWMPKFKDVKRGFSLSCGCSSNRVSTQNLEIKNYIESLGAEVKLEGSIGPYKYDLIIPECKIAIEYHGLKWHSGKDNEIDVKKSANAALHGYSTIIIYADEWEKKNAQICSIIAYRIGKIGDRIRLRPSKCETRLIDSKIADQFYNKYHYIGATKAKINLAVVYNEEIIACISFKSPNRRSGYQYELTRMVSHPSYSVHGVWSYLLKIFECKFNPQSIVSFSDNRLFTGDVYRKIGFRFDGDVRKDYYWMRGRHRYNKSGLRKPPGTTETESELRHSQGFVKIWDIGKKRWVYERQN